MASRIRSLDLLRATAVIAVILYHYPKSPDQVALRAVSHFGWMGVDLFFVLSGFLIGGQLFSLLRSHQPRGFRDFYLKRLFRTLPCYFVTLAGFAAVAVVEGKGLGWIGPFFWFGQNLVTFPVTFSTSWSLCVEEHFYLLFPLIAFALARGGYRAIMAFLAATVLFGIGARFAIWQQVRPDLVYARDVNRAFEIFLGNIFYPTYCRLDGISCGLALAATKAYRADRWARLQRRANAWLLLGLGLLALAALTQARRMGPASSVLAFPLLSAGFALCVLAASGPSWLERARIPGVGAIAISSYSLYLSHSLALWAAERAHHAWALPALPLNLVAIAAGGALLYFGVERPSLRIREHFLARPIRAAHGTLRGSALLPRHEMFAEPLGGAAGHHLDRAGFLEEMRGPGHDG